MMSQTTPRFAALIAAHNEEDLVCDTLVSVSRVPGVVGIIVADDGSSDSTGVEAARAGALVVGTNRNCGKGAAMELAVQTLLQRRPFGELDGVLLLDADLGESAKEAAELLEPLCNESADLVIGVLPPPPHKAGFGFVKGLARDGIALHGNGFNAQAPLSGQRALTLACLNQVRPFADGYAIEVDMTIRALQKDLKVIEVPVAMTHRHSGRNIRGFLHRGKQFLHIYKLLSSMAKAKERASL